MAQVTRTGQAGTLESNDIIVTVAPCEQGSGINIELESIVLAQYGEAILSTMKAIIKELGITDIQVKALDRGALDCTIRARTLAALARAGVVLKEDVL